MKYLKYISICLLVLGVGAMFVAFTENSNADRIGAKNKIYDDFDAETLTNSDTATFTLGSHYNPYEYQILVSGDSISGTIATTCYIQQSCSYTSSNWANIDTAVIVDSATPTRLIESGTITGGRLRCICYSSGTQVATVDVSAQLTLRTPN